jgi:hypothetical protein
MAAAVTKANVAKLHHDLRDRPFLANRTIAVVGSMYSWAGKRGLIPDGYNPAGKVEKSRALGCSSQGPDITNGGNAQTADTQSSGERPYQTRVQAFRSGEAFFQFLHAARLARPWYRVYIQELEYNNRSGSFVGINRKQMLRRA